MSYRLATKGEQSRELILEAASSLIAEKGFSAITLQDILTAAGVKKGRFFHYFASKDDLFSELLRNALRSRAVRSHAESLAECSETEPFERLLFLVNRQVEWHSHGLPAGMRLCLFATFFFPPDSPEMKNIHDLLTSNAKVIENLVLECQRKGDLPAELNPQTLSLLFPSAAIGGSIVGHLCALPRLTLQHIVELRQMLLYLHEASKASRSRS